ncbi:MAG: RNA-binding S4 domain-containing protein [Alphaproteobacteria bacterium]
MSTGPAAGDAAPRMRLDTWLWCTRFFRSRALATRFCEEGSVRVNGVRTAKAHHAIRPGDVLTFPLGSNIRVARVSALAARRGPAGEARALYDDLSAPQAG